MIPQVEDFFRPAIRGDLTSNPEKLMWYERFDKAQNGWGYKKYVVALGIKQQRFLVGSF